MSYVDERQAGGGDGGIEIARLFRVARGVVAGQLGAESLRRREPWYVGRHVVAKKEGVDARVLAQHQAVALRAIELFERRERRAAVALRRDRRTRRVGYGHGAVPAEQPVVFH